MHIYITRKIPDVGLNLLKENGITFDIGATNKDLSINKIIKDLKKKPYDGVISFLTNKIDKEVFDACPTAKIFANYAVGFNNIDIDEARKRNIEITNTPGTSALAVAEHTVALILSLTTRLNEGDKYICNGKYRGWSPDLFIGTDLSNKTIGLIGAGEIGMEVARILYNGFNNKIIYSDVLENKKLEESTGAIRKTQDEVLEEGDIISLHVPLLPSTHHLIDSSALSKMKSSAFIINTSRGPVIDEKALVEALKDKKIAGAGLDVFECEPKITKGLKKLPNVVMTPHIASARNSARNMMSEIAAKNIISFLKTGKAINSVCKK